MKFVDTSFWVAYQFRKDPNHAAATSVWREGHGPYLTTNHVVGETWTWLRRRLGHAEALRFVEAITHSPAVSIHHVAPEEEREAWRWLARRDEREYSFVDATSFAVMRRARIREALAFDSDFEAAGFVQARP